MKLELKHVASYIAYKIKVWDNKNNKPKTLHCTQLNIPIVEDDRYMLILRPLSDLTKEDLYYLLNHHSTYWFADTDFENTIIKGLEHKKLHNFIEFLPFGLVQWFIENHYDIFGLIESGQAIDINTLNK